MVDLEREREGKKFNLFFVFSHWRRCRWCGWMRDKMRLWASSRSKVMGGKTKMYLQRIWSVWVVITLSASCRLIPWQSNEIERLLESTVIEIFDDVIQPPSLLASTFDAFVRRWRPSIVHLISAAGCDGAVTQWKLTTSPWRDSVGPVIVTCDGETRDVIGKREK